MTIGKDFSNFFNTHLKNGNIAKWSGVIGQTAMGLGMMSAIMKDGNNSHGCCCNDSVFNGYMNMGCGGYVGRQFTFGGIGISQHLLNNPMDILNTPMAYQNNFGMNCGGYMSNYGMLNDYMNPYSYPVMQQYSQYPMMNPFMPIQQENINNTNDAGKVDTNQDTTQGQAFADFTKNIVNEEDKIVDGSIKLFDKTDKPEDYKTNLSKAGKSYAALIDQNGNKDGYVTKEEYVAFKTKGITDPEKLKNTKALAENEFDRINLNGNQYLDWKELTTMRAAMDSQDGKGTDGTITAHEFAQWHSQITDVDDKYQTRSQNIFKNLFGNE